MPKKEDYILGENHKQIVMSCL